MLRSWGADKLCWGTELAHNVNPIRPVPGPLQRNGELLGNGSTSESSVLSSKSLI
jgi:hypothetical protein